MKTQILTALLTLLCAVGYSQETKLLGDLRISLKEGTLESDFYITNLSTKDKALRFMINDGIKVESIMIADQKKRFRKSSRSISCPDCSVYNLSLNENLTPSDTILIKTKGTFKSYQDGQNTKDYKGKIVSNYGILRASEQSKWYPVVFSAQDKKPSFLKKHSYSYQITSTCDDCDYIYIGQDKPKVSGSVFTSPTAIEDIMLIAGNYEWKEGKNALFINMTDDAIINHIDSLFFEINSYYEGLTDIKMPAKFTYAHLPSDNTSWGAFLTYPTIVDVKKTLRKNSLEANLSHEIAHYLFGNVYKPESKLYWFYLESFAQYFSFKYLLEKNPALLKGRLSYLNEKNFVRLDKVTGYAQINNSHRYSIGPFQLLAIEEKIGEAQMMRYIKEVFSNLTKDADGYAVLIESLHKIGVEKSIIQSIENDLIKRFDINEYKFIEQRLTSYSHHQ
jgi:hypothetical protein